MLLTLYDLLLMKNIKNQATFFKKNITTKYIKVHEPPKTKFYTILICLLLKDMAIYLDNLIF
jgi:hypothetical protein